MKNRRSVLAVGAILLAVVLLIAFAVPFARTGVFYIALGFEIAAFLVALFAAHVAFEKGEDTRSRFYGFPIARIGAVYLIAETALSLILMALSRICPAWAAAVVQAILLAAAAVGIDLGRRAAERGGVGRTSKPKTDVSRMRALQSRALTLPGRAANAETKRALNALSDAMKYSDPVGSEATAGAEETLASLLDEIEKSLVDGDEAAAGALCAQAGAALTERNRICRLNEVKKNATTKVDQGEYNLRYDALETQCDAISDKQKRIKEKLADKLFRKRKLEAFMSELKSAEQLISFDEQLFIRTVEQITVFSDKLVFVFKDGTEIPVEE